MSKKNRLKRFCNFKSSNSIGFSKKKIKVYRFWKLRFFYIIPKKFAMAPEEAPRVLVKTYSYKRFSRGRSLFSYIKYISIHSFYASFLETQFIYCILGYLNLLTDDTSWFLEIFYSTIYFYIYFYKWDFFCLQFSNFCNYVRKLVYGSFVYNILIFFVQPLISFFNSFIILLKDNKVTDFKSSPLTFTNNYKIAEEPIFFIITVFKKNLIFFFNVVTSKFK